LAFFDAAATLALSGFVGAKAHRPRRGKRLIKVLSAVSRVRNATPNPCEPKPVKYLRKTFADDTKTIAAIALLGLVMIALFRP
jgi:hypothetical protein